MIPQSVVSSIIVLLVDKLVIRAAVAVAAMAILASICAAAAVPAIMGAPSEYRVGNFGSSEGDDDDAHTIVDDDELLLVLFDVDGDW